MADRPGYLVVGRNERPLADLYVLRALLPAVTVSRPRGNGWQVCELGGEAAIADSVSLLVDLAAATRAPALLASATDGDGATVEGFSGSGGYWKAALPVTGTGPLPVAELAARVVAWAASAQHPVAPAPVVEFLRAPGRDRVDGMLEELLALLGLAAPVAHVAGQRVSRNRSRTRVPNLSPSTGTRSSTPWNMPR
ncbi:hypothetical protein GCM10023085_77710 [Actinomadura viridis]|uniref:Uncharacterized protein n=1 Tax=Actinomadura viridis TaxID=58110 RepID=A0A931DLP4_9ACTN|nr:hypothetical protein [Actinomadura viridis]MBG6090327.1 hypothetical protein [Actinomadura viridis]